MENEDMLKRNDLMSFISEYLEMEIEYKKISQIKWDVFRNIEAPILTNKYDKLTLKDFIILYKIDKLLEENKISLEIANKLTELLYLKLELGEKIGIIALHDEEEKQQELKRLLQAYSKIEDIFNKYHLKESKYYFKKMIDGTIKSSKDIFDNKESINVDDLINDVNLLDDLDKKIK